MIKFFRKIRQKLLSENKFSKYLLYAVGEILLVIIGILIALSINNWNEHRKLKIEEQSSLKDLRGEVASNIEALEHALKFHQISYETALKFGNLFDNRAAFEVMPDSVFRDEFFKMVNANTFDPRLGILNSLISSGKINNISNKELMYSLSSLEDQIKDALEDQEKIDNTFDDYIRSIYINTSSIVDGKNQGSNHKARYDNSEFRIMVKRLFLTYRGNGLIEERELLETLNHILTLIDQEVEK
ncbi:DUF6090 family protein [Gaetbulibacter aquiaggeris]|uniref:DUF6090 family protein n=1 Tax=Gaetbulibacter aquiaggeris TaxID=1735373 RepID=A0ABW7MNA1_9FLAO